MSDKKVVVKPDIKAEPQLKKEPPIKTKPDEYTMQTLAFKIVTDNQLSKKSVFKDQFNAIVKTVTKDVVPLIQEGWNWRSFQTLMYLINYYQNKV